jgi:TPR repeat protein
MKATLATILMISFLLTGCSGGKQIEIGENLSKEDQAIAFRTVLDEQYKAGDYKSAFKNFEKIAQQGNQDAAFFVAISYTKGRGVKKDWNKGVELMKSLADKGYPQALDFLGKELKANAVAKGNGPIEWLEVSQKAAQAGDVRAWEELSDYFKKNGEKKKAFDYQLGLARYFFLRKNETSVSITFLTGNLENEKNIIEAIYWIFSQDNLLEPAKIIEATPESFKKMVKFIVAQKLAIEEDRKNQSSRTADFAACQNDSVLALKPEEIHFALKATQFKQYDAIEILKKYISLDFLRQKRKLIREKDADGLYRLALNSYDLIPAVFKDGQTALEILKIAGESGSNKALIRLGDIHTIDPKDAQPFKHGISYYKKAAARGASQAYLKLSEVLTRSLDYHERSREEIEKLILPLAEEGAAKGDPEAMVTIARFLQQRSGDEFQARVIELLTESNRLGSIDGAFELARLYLFKSKDDKKQEAIDLLEKSVLQGHLPSIELLFEVNNANGENYSFAAIKDWLRKSSAEERISAHLFLMKFYLDKGKFREAYRWVAASYLDNFNKAQQNLKNHLNEEICKNLSAAEIDTIIREEVGAQDEMRKLIRRNEINRAIQTELGVLHALLRYGLLDHYNKFEDIIDLQPILFRLEELAAKDVKFAGFFLGAVKSRSYSLYYNPEQAEKAFKASAKAGNPYALFRLAEMAQCRADDPFACDEADLLYNQAANEGLESAKLQVGFRLCRENNFADALQIFSELSREGNVWAKLALADLYENGRGTAKNLEQAVKLYESVTRYYQAVYPFYKRAHRQWSKDPAAEASGENFPERADPAAEDAAKNILLDRFLKNALEN